MESRMDFPDGSSNGARTREVMEVEGDGVRRKPTFGTQANALLRKNITFQKRNWGTNCCIVGWPIFTCIALLIAQIAINGAFSGSDYKCGCQNGVCGIEYSTSDQADYCAVPHPPAWPGVIQVPRPQYRSSVLSMGFTSADNPTSMLFTGANPTASLLASYLLLNNAPTNTTDSLVEYSNLVSGSGSWPGGGSTAIIEPAFLGNEPLYVLQNRSCGANSAEPDFNFQFQASFPVVRYPAKCLPTQVINRVSREAIDDELYKGFRKGDPSGNPSQKINEYASAYDFGNTDQKNFDVNVYYNETLTNDTSQAPPGYARASKSMNLAAQAFLRYIQGPQAQLPLWFVKEMPRVSSKLTLDLSSVIGPLFYMWCDQILFIIILVSLVYEKQRNLRIMMKMHGLGDGAYWIISYLYFLALSLVYIFFFVLVGSLIKLNFFRLNSYVIQFIFYFIYLNLQIALGFLAASLFRNVKTATVCGYLYVFAFGLLGSFLFQNFLEDKNTGRGWVFAMELIPGFSLYRGLYEFGAYAFSGAYQNTHGMTWKDLKDKDNGMTTVWLIQIVEWALFLALAWYLDRAVSTGGGVRKRPLFFLGNLFKKRFSSSLTPQKSPSKSAGDEVNIEMEKADVAQEAAVVERLLHDRSAQDNNSYAIICNQLKKVYPGTDGNPDKYAVRGLSLAVGRSECFGMLGPNGAGKTSTINMMIGLQKPTSGTAYIKGLDIRTDIDQIYTSMGVCPQHDLIWERLTAREHLLFYGRLKNLKGAALEEAVVASLKSVNLYNGLEKKRAGQFSGGMKRRLSVAISLIGDPQVVYMDEPSTGLDPASRFNLWNVVKQAKRGRAIILTTHSMEEAEALCDRLGIFVDGQLQCIGDSKELTARYGGIYVITITTPANEEGEVQKLVESLSPNSQKVYSLAGTQKFEIPKSDVEIGEVFATMENAKNHLSIQAWGLADTTLEDVFVKVARGVQGGDTLS